MRKVIISKTYVLGSDEVDWGLEGIQLYSASSKKDSILEAMTELIRPSAVVRVLANDWQEDRWTGPPLCEALSDTVHHGYYRLKLDLTSDSSRHLLARRKRCKSAPG